LWERDEMRREGACEVEGKRDATWGASRQPSVFMLTRRAAVFAALTRRRGSLLIVRERCRLMKENAEGTYKTKHAEAARLIYTTMSTTHGHIGA
jgi:hypothetical protein